MLKIQKLIIVLIMFIFVAINLYDVCYAQVEQITEKELNDSLQNLVKEQENMKIESIKCADNIMEITSEGKKNEIKYDLTQDNKAIFYLEVPIYKGMKYTEYKEKTNNLINTSIGYFATANIKGAKYEDITEYWFARYFESINGSFSSENTYVIVDDENLEDGVTIEPTDDPKTIYTSEFGDRVMEYTKFLYKDEYSYDDSKYLNSFEYYTKLEDVKEDSCIIKSQMVVNLNADFKAVGNYDENGNIINDTKNNTITNNTINNNVVNNVVKNNTLTNSLNKNTNNILKNTDNTIANKVLPQTGFNQFMVLLINGSVIIGLLFIIKLNKYKDVK